jgi:predicted ATP-dependent serine protease
VLAACVLLGHLLLQVWERAKRLGIVDAMTSSSSSSSPPLDVRLLMAEDLLKIIEVVFELLPAAIIVDSIQTVRDPNSNSRPGSVTQVGGGYVRV